MNLKHWAIRKLDPIWVPSPPPGYEIEPYNESLHLRRVVDGAWMYADTPWLRPIVGGDSRHHRIILRREAHRLPDALRLNLDDPTVFEAVQWFLVMRLVCHLSEDRGNKMRAAFAGKRGGDA